MDIGRPLIKDEPIQSHLHDRLGKLGKVHRLAHVAVGASGRLETSCGRGAFRLATTCTIASGVKGLLSGFASRIP
jgi:hypothetical protein